MNNRDTELRRFARYLATLSEDLERTRRSQEAKLVLKLIINEFVFRFPHLKDEVKSASQKEW